MSFNLYRKYHFLLNYSNIKFAYHTHSFYLSFSLKA